MNVALGCIAAARTKLCKLVKEQAAKEAAAASKSLAERSMPKRYCAADLDPALINLIDSCLTIMTMDSLHASNFLALTVDGPEQI